MARGVGRKKIQIKKIENQSRRDVTFSKRRCGLYKKASELSILCDCHVAIVIFSAMDKIFTFGHPCVEHIFDSFINMKPHQNSVVHEDSEFREQDKEILGHDAIIEAEKSQQKFMNDQLLNDPQDQNCIKKLWFEELTLAEAEEMVAKLDELKHFIEISRMQSDSWFNLNGQQTTKYGVSFVDHPCGDDEGHLASPDPQLASTSRICVGCGDESKTTR